MHMRFSPLLAILAALLMLASAGCPSAQPVSEGDYEFGRASRDGIGKFYMGREISAVMGHLGAGWLERPVNARNARTC